MGRLDAQAMGRVGADIRQHVTGAQLSDLIVDVGGLMTQPETA